MTEIGTSVEGRRAAKKISKRFLMDQMIGDCIKDMAEIIDESYREVRAALSDLVNAIEAKADIGKRRELTVSPSMEEVLARASRILGDKK